MFFWSEILCLRSGRTARLRESVLVTYTVLDRFALEAGLFSGENFFGNTVCGLSAPGADFILRSYCYGLNRSFGFGIWSIRDLPLWGTKRQLAVDIYFLFSIALRRTIELSFSNTNWKLWGRSKALTLSPLLLLLFVTLFRSRKLFMTLGRLLLTSSPWHERPGRPPMIRQAVTWPFWMNWKEDLISSPPLLIRWYYRLLGGPLRVKVAKESSALLKTIQREEPGFQCPNSTRQFRRRHPYVYSPDNCHRCGLPGHFRQGLWPRRRPRKLWWKLWCKWCRGMGHVFFFVRFFYLWNSCNLT